MNELPSFFRPVHRDSLSEYIENWDFRPIQFGYWCESRGRVLKDSILNQYMLILMSQGQCQIQCQNGLFTLNQYDGVIIPPYLMYSVVCTSSDPVQCFYLGYEICNQRMKEQYAHLDSIANLQYLPGLAGASHIMRLRQMALDCQADKPGVFLQLRGMLNSCLIPLFAREAQGCEAFPIFFIARLTTGYADTASANPCHPCVSPTEVFPRLPRNSVFLLFIITPAYLKRSWANPLPFTEGRSWQRTRLPK